MICGAVQPPVAEFGKVPIAGVAPIELADQIGR
jgi:hypothetical protein